jgi:glycosyltransferase involved in cell wall biosynthesis
LKTTVIVTTYNRPDALREVIRGFTNQEDLRFDLIVADDGSEDETGSMLKSMADSLPFSLKHVWHEDLGFRAAAIRNKAIVQSNADYLIFTDGDCIPQKNFVKNHKKLAERGWVLSGNRILMSRVMTNELLRERLDWSGWGASNFVINYLRRRINRLLPLVDLSAIESFRKLQAKKWRGVKTCNLSVWKSDIVAVNGFEESYQGWGLEDSDLVVRLIKKGLCVKSARFATPVLHLWHEENDRSQLTENQRLLDAVIASDTHEAKIGLDNHQVSGR